MPFWHPDFPNQVEWMPFWLLLKVPPWESPNMSGHVCCILMFIVILKITCFGSSFQTSLESIMVFGDWFAIWKRMIGVCKRSMLGNFTVLIGSCPRMGSQKIFIWVWMINGEIFLERLKNPMKAPNLWTSCASESRDIYPNLGPRKISVANGPGPDLAAFLF